MSNESWVTPEDALNVPSEGSWSSKATFIPATDTNLEAYIPTRWLNADSSSVITPDFPVINEDNLNKIELGIALLDSFLKNDSVGYSYNIKRLQEVIDALYESLTSLHSYVNYHNDVQNKTFRDTIGTSGGDLAFSNINPISDAIGKADGKVFISSQQPLLSILGTVGDGVSKKCAFGTSTKENDGSSNMLTVKATIDKEIEDRQKAVENEANERKAAIGTASDETTKSTVYGSINLVQHNLDAVEESAYEALENLFNHFKGKLEEVYSDIGESTSTDSNTVYGYVNNNIEKFSDEFENNLSTVEEKFDNKFSTFTLNDVHDTEQEEIVLDAGTSVGYT